MVKKTQNKIRPNPLVIAQLNDYQLKLVKIQDEFVWHCHEDTDEVFFVVEGEMAIEFRDGTLKLSAGELFVVPKGVEHKPIAEDVAHVVLFEPTTTRSTGEVDHAHTVKPEALERL